MTISYARHQFPPPVIQHTVWLYLRFTLSFRDVEDLLAERGLDISYETVRRGVTKFGPQFARELRSRRSKPTSQCHLDEMVVSIAGRHFWLWRAVDDEDEVLDQQLIDDYDATAGARTRQLRGLVGKAPGDPVRAAAAIVQAVEDPTAPLRLELGKVALAAARDKIDSMRRDFESWAAISEEADFPVP
jgi:DDE domain